MGSVLFPPINISASGLEKFQTPPLPPPLEGRGVAQESPPLESRGTSALFVETALKSSATNSRRQLSATLLKPLQPIGAWPRNENWKAQASAAGRAGPRCLPTSRLAQPSRTPPACRAVVVSIYPVSYSLFVKVFFHHLGQHLSGSEKHGRGCAFLDA